MGRMLACVAQATPSPVPLPCLFALSKRPRKNEPSGAHSKCNAGAHPKLHTAHNGNQSSRGNQWAVVPINGQWVGGAYNGLPVPTERPVGTAHFQPSSADPWEPLPTHGLDKHGAHIRPLMGTVVPIGACMGTSSLVPTQWAPEVWCNVARTSCGNQEMGTACPQWAPYLVGNSLAGRCGVASAAVEGPFGCLRSNK